MPTGPRLAETTIFVPDHELEPVIDGLKETGLNVLPHQFSAVHHNKDGNTPGRLVDVLGFYPSLATILARTLTANGLERLNKPVIIFPFE